MNGRSAGGLVLLLVGSLALIGYLTGNLDRWLAALFTPPAGPAPVPAHGDTGDQLTSVVIPYPPGGNLRGAGA